MEQYIDDQFGASICREYLPRTKTLPMQRVQLVGQQLHHWLILRSLKSNYRSRNWKSLTFLPFSVAYKERLTVPHNQKTSTSARCCFGSHFQKLGLELPVERSDEYKINQGAHTRK